MAASERGAFAGRSYIVQCPSPKFIHAAWLSAVHSEVISVDEAAGSLRISPMSDFLRGQLERLGASVLPALR